ncbi:tyrosine-type recombinase/integrase [Kitasatospora arboriphila]
MIRTAADALLAAGRTGEPGAPYAASDPEPIHGDDGAVASWTFAADLDGHTAYGWVLADGRLSPLAGPTREGAAEFARRALQPAAALPALRTPAAVEQAATVDRMLSAAAAAAVAAGIPASTRRAYDTDMRAFTSWCTAVGRTALPATPQTVTEYVTHLTTTPRPRTGLAARPGQHRARPGRDPHRPQGRRPPGPGDQGRPQGAVRLPGPPRRDEGPRRRPATGQPGRAIRAAGDGGGLDRTTLQGARDAALVLLGFATAARVSELAALDLADVVTVDHGLDATVYRRKIKAFTESAVLHGSDPATCPVRAVLAYREQLHAAGRTDGPLFVRINRHGRIAAPMLRRGRPVGDPAGRLTSEAVGDVVAKLADAAGLEGQWSGHSLRRGFATAARQAGHDLVSIGRAADGPTAPAPCCATSTRSTASPARP